MERLDFTNQSSYIAIESAIHFNRYFTAKPLVEGKRVLDIACGEGYGSKLLKRWGATEVIGVDASKEAIKHAQTFFQEDGIMYYQHYAEKLPFENDSFDIVISFETIEHVDNPQKFLSEISRVLKFGGIAIISCPNDPYYQKSGEPQNPFHKRTFSWFEFSELTQSYLGDTVDWYFGFATNGFMNVPLTQCTEPGKDKMAPESMLGMFEYTLLDKVTLVPQDRYLNHWNCNYYLGIWGAKNCLQNATIFPREYFEKPDDPNIADMSKLTQQLKQQELDYKNLLEDQKAGYDKCVTEMQKSFQSKLELITIKNEELIKEQEASLMVMQNLKEEHRIMGIEKSRMSSLLELENKENLILWDRIHSFELNEDTNKTELLKYKEQVEKVQNDINTIKQTKGYRILRKCWDFIDKIKGI